MLIRRLYASAHQQSEKCFVYNYGREEAVKHLLFAEKFTRLEANTLINWAIKQGIVYNRDNAFQIDLNELYKFEVYNEKNVVVPQQEDSKLFQELAKDYDNLTIPQKVYATYNGTVYPADKVVLCAWWINYVQPRIVSYNTEGEEFLILVPPDLNKGF